MGIKIGLSGLNDYSKTLDMVRSQDAGAKVAPDYDAVLRYVNSGSSRGELRVKYGNHQREMELGTKGLFAKGERHALTAQVLSDVVATRFGPRAAQKFMDRVAVPQEGQGIRYQLDKAHVREVLQELEAQHANAPVTLPDSERLSEPSGPVSIKPELFNFNAGDASAWRADFADTWKSAKARDAEGWPQNFVADLNRGRAEVQGHRWLSTFGGGQSTDAQFQKVQKEKFTTFLEDASGVSRTQPEFEHLRNNLARNLHQGFAADLVLPFLKHALPLGYMPPDTDNVAARTELGLAFEDGHFRIERKTDIPLRFAEGFAVNAAMTDSFRLPLHALMATESAFDIAAAIVDPQRTVLIRPEQ